MKEKPKKYTREWFVEQGRKGGQKTKDLYGRKHFKEIPSLKVDKSKKLEKSPIKQRT